MATYVVTSSLSEFRINKDRSIDRMSASAITFSDWAPAGSSWMSIEIGCPMLGQTPIGPFCTSQVRAVTWKDDGL